MKSTDMQLIKIENTKEFDFVVLSEDLSAVSLLFPKGHERLRRFQNITVVERVSDLLSIYTSHRNRKLIMLVDVTSRHHLSELKEMVYSVHSESRGLLFAFTFGRCLENEFDRLISAGFDEVFELQGDEEKRHLRMYSWIRRFGGNPISDTNAEKNAIKYLSNKKNNRIGGWTVIGRELAACNDIGQKVKLTRQEVDFLTLLFEGDSLAKDPSYEKLFKAPHAIVNKLKKKLGSDLPIQHDSGGRYSLRTSG